MPSTAYANHLNAVLQDADEINQAHESLRTGERGRQYGLGALNRAVVVMCISAWEIYLEECVKECIELLKPNDNRVGPWQSYKVNTLSQVGRFHNPNVQNTRSLIHNCIGLEDVTRSWYWPGMSADNAVRKLDDACNKRHRIAHGSIPRPTVHNQPYASILSDFFRRLGSRTDTGITRYLSQEFDIETGW